MLKNITTNSNSNIRLIDRSIWRSIHQYSAITLCINGLAFCIYLCVRDRAKKSRDRIVLFAIKFIQSSGRTHIATAPAIPRFTRVRRDQSRARSTRDALDTAPYSRERERGASRVAREPHTHTRHTHSQWRICTYRVRAHAPHSRTLRARARTNTHMHTQAHARFCRMPLGRHALRTHAAPREPPPPPPPPHTHILARTQNPARTRNVA